MTSLTTEILGLSIAYALLGVLLLTACLFTRVPWPLKAVAIVLTSIFYVVTFYAGRGLLGWSSVDPLPPRFKLLHARIVEPHSLAGDPGAIRFVDQEAIDDDNPPERRAPSLSPALQRQTCRTSRSRNQSPAPTVSRRGGRTADLGTGEGGEGPDYSAGSHAEFDYHDWRAWRSLSWRTAGSGNSARREPVALCSRRCRRPACR